MVGLAAGKRETSAPPGAVVVHEKHTSASLCPGDGQRAAPGQLEGIMNRVVPEACAPRRLLPPQVARGTLVAVSSFQGWT